MKRTYLQLVIIMAMALSLIVGININAMSADIDGIKDKFHDVKHGGRKAEYKVTIHNLTAGQPLSPPVAATHKGEISMFETGKLASPGLEAIAEDGDQSMMAMRFEMSKDTSQTVDVGMPVPLNGTLNASGIPIDAATFEIKARRDDRFSFATMLICSNDGFTGLDRASLPVSGASIFLISAYDANTEMNTQESTDIVDPCSALGPVALFGDPNGNENDAVAMMPPLPIALHPGIMENKGNLTVADHGWTDPVVKVTINLVNNHARTFVAHLSGAGEVPPVETFATGKALFKLNHREQTLSYTLDVQNIEGVTQAHIHIGMPNMNRPVVAFLFGLVDPGGFVNGRLAEGTISADDLIGPLEGNFEGLVNALLGGSLYVNVHTADNPGGEIRGQIGANW